MVLKAAFFLFFSLLNRCHSFTALISSSLELDYGYNSFIEGSLFVLNTFRHFVSERLPRMHLADPTLFTGLKPRHDT